MGRYLRSTSVEEMNEILARYARAPQHVYPELAVRIRWAHVNGIDVGSPIDRRALDYEFESAYAAIRFGAGATTRPRALPFSHLRLVPALH